MSQEFRRVTSADVNAELQRIIEERLLAVITQRDCGHCMRVGDLDTVVMLAVARSLRQTVGASAQVHVLSREVRNTDSLLITSSKLVELRNPLTEGELRPPLLVFVPNDLRTAAEDSFAEATFEQVSVADAFVLLRTRLSEQLPESLRTAVPEILTLLEDRDWRWADALAGNSSTSATRCRTDCTTQKPSRHGTKRPSATQASSELGASAALTATGAGPGANAPQASSASTASAKRFQTWPMPNGTAAGNSKAAGQANSSANTPRDWGASQRRCHASHQASQPARASASASSAPKAAPAVLRSQSSREATRWGK